MRERRKTAGEGRGEGRGRRAARQARELFVGAANERAPSLRGQPAVSGAADPMTLPSHVPGSLSDAKTSGVGMRHDSGSTLKPSTGSI